MKRAYAVIALVYLALYLVPLGVRPLYSPDETRYAEIPREMLVTGEWVVPRLDGLLYFEKPPLGYWLTAASMKLLGQTSYAARLPSALATGLTALVLALVCHRRDGPAGVGPLAVLVYLTFPLVFVIGMSNILDGIFNLFLTGCLAAYYEASCLGRGRSRAVLLGLCGLSCGLAFLVKGFLAFVLAGLVVGGYLVYLRRWSALVRDAWIPLAAAVVTASPWAVLIALREPDFWRYFIWVEHIHRFLAADYLQHVEPFWFYLPVLGMALASWLPLIPAALLGLRGETGGASLVRFAWVWALLPFLFLSASRGKLETYLLPCMPAVALLSAIGLSRAVNRAGARGIRIGAAVAAGLGAAGLAAVATLDGSPGFAEHEGWKRGLLLAVLAWWVVAALIAAGWRGRSRRRLWIYATAPVAFLLALSWVVPAAVTRRQALGDLELLLAAAPDEQSAVVVADRETVHAVCWRLERRDVLLLGDPGELSYGVSRSGAGGRLLDPDGLKRRLTGDPAPTSVTLLVERRNYDLVARWLPAPADYQEEGRFVRVQYTPPVAGQSMRRVPSSNR